MSGARTSATARGVGWMAGGQLIMLAFGFAKLAVLARVLEPLEVGLFFLALATVGVVESVSEFGLDRDLVQRKSVDAADLGAVWLVQAVRGALVAALLAVGAGAAEALLQSPALGPVLVAFGVSAAARGLRTPAHALHERNLRFRRVSLFEAGVAMADTAVVLALVTNVPLAESAAWGSAAVRGVAALVSWLVFPARVRLRWEREPWARLGRVAGQFSVSGVLTYIMSRLDDLLVARVLGTVAVATWGLGYRLSELPIRLTGQAGTRPATSHFARITENGDDVSAPFAGWFTAQQTLILAFAGGAVVAGPAIVRAIWGFEWSASGPVLQALALTIIGRGVSHAVAPVLIGTGRYADLVRMKWIEAGAFVIAFVSFLSVWGLIGACIGSGVGYSVAVLARIGLLRRLGIAQPRALMRAWAPAWATTLLASVVGAAVALAWSEISALRDACVIGAFVATWLLAVRVVFGRSAVAIMRELARGDSTPRR